MAPNVTVSFWAANDINGTPLLTITDEDTFFKGLKLTPDLYSLGGWELTLSRAWGFQLFGSGAVDAEVFVRFMVHAYSDSTWYYGGVLNKRDLTVVHRQEIGAEELVIGGSGPKGYMDRSALGIQQRTDLGMNLDLENGVWRWNEAANAGRVLITAINEDAGHSNPALPDLTDNFNLADDSDGNAWTNEITAGPAEYQTPIGSSLLDIIFDLEDLADLYTTVHLGSLATPKYELNAFQVFGDDNSGSAFGPGVGLLREGVNIANDALTVQGVAFRKATHVIVEGKDHVWVVEIKPSWSPGDYVKWDKITYSRSSSEDILHRAGLRWLQRQDNGDQQLTVEIVPGNSPDTGYYFPAPNDPIWLGNTISLDTVADGSVHSPLDYNNAPQLVTGLELALGEAGDNSTADREAKSWDVKVRLNWERAGHAASPDQQSASTIICRCQGQNHPPPPCIPPTPDNVLLDSTATPASWPGSNTTAGSCWGGTAHMSMGGSGGQSSQVSVAPGDVITGTINFREETGNNSWENNSNYSYTAWLKLEGPGQPAAMHVIVDQLYHNTGCIDVDHEKTVIIPTGYNTARILFDHKLGGIRYIAQITSSVDAPPDVPFCVDPTLPADSPYSYPSDTVDALIAQEIANAKVGTVRRYMLNNSGAALSAGDLVIPDVSTLDAVTTTTSNHQTASPVGIVTEGGSDQEQVLVVWYGIVASLTTPDTAAAGDYLYTSAVDGEGDLSATRGAGAVGQIAEDSGELVVYLWGTPDTGDTAGSGGSGADTSALFPGSAITLTKDAANPTFNYNAIPETITKVGDTYYAVSQTSAQDPVNLNTATDRDGPWTAYAGNPIYEFSDVTWAPGSADGLYAPEIVEDDGTFYLFYSIVDTGDGTDGHIGVATAASITGPYTDHGSAILSPGASSVWDSLRVGEPSVIHHDGRWVMAYMGEDNSFAFGASEKVGFATASSPTGTWTKAAGNPLIDWSVGEWDDELTADPFIFFENGYYWCWYTGGSPTPWKAGLAYALDPTGTWTKHADNPLLVPGSSGAWDDEGSWRGSVFIEDGLLSGIYGGIPTAGSLSNVKGGNFRLTVTAQPFGEPNADAHIADTADAHDASAVSILDTGGYFTATDVEGALQEIGSESPEVKWIVDAGATVYSGTGPVTVALTSKFGITAGGSPYYNSADVTDGEEAALGWDATSETYFLRRYY